MISSARINQIVLIIAILLLNLNCTEKPAEQVEIETESIRVYTENPYYFQYHGKPVLLLGATDYHNIFQRPNLEEHLDRMQAAGGNYIRNTMASREITEDHNDLWPYQIVERTDDPLINIYDLDRFDEEYWNRFSKMLEETYKRGIFVEIELWERHDTYRTRDQAGWLRHPYNPDNNVNFTSENSGLPAGAWTEERVYTGHPFFNTVPNLQNNKLVLEYQKAFIDKLLSYTKDYDHILYNMNNETQEHHYFGEYWAEYLFAWASTLGKHIELTDMQDNHNVTEEPVQRVMESSIYTFVDISQNNFQSGDTHWERIQYIRNFLSESPRPITNIKVYGTDTAPPPVAFWGDTDEAVQRFWRNILGGCASARFHRPPWGIGLNDIGYNNLLSMRMITDEMDFFNYVPANHLLEERTENEAFCMAYPDNEYVIYFPAGGYVHLNATPGNYEVTWLRTHIAEWQEPYKMEMPGNIETPDIDHWVVLIRKVS